MHLLPVHRMPLIYSPWTNVVRSAPPMEALTNLTEGSAEAGTEPVPAIARANIRGAIKALMVNSGLCTCATLCTFLQALT